MAKLYTRKSDGTYVPYNPQSVTNIDVVQTTGNSVTAAMSQDAVTKELASKQDTLTTGNGISIEGNVIGVTAITESESQPDTSLWLNPSEDAETGLTYNRSQIDAMVGAKQDALQLTVKDNGNIVLSNIQGQSKEFMPATPSGDPMHYAYVAAGAVYNDTGADIIKTTPWADMVDDDADKVVTHKAGYWYLNGLGDITNEQMRVIYLEAPTTLFTQDSAAKQSGRTNIPFKSIESSTSVMRAGSSSKSEVISTKGDILISTATAMFYHSNQLVHIIANLNFVYAKANALNSVEFRDDVALKSVRIFNLKVSINFQHCKLLTTKSILHMIQNEAATSAITITLHADVYNRCMANTDIVAALQAHPNVSLASA